MQSLEEFRTKQFPQLDQTIYFDFAGANIASQSQVKRYQFLTNEVLSNPHSASQISRSSNEIAQLRSELLNQMNTSPDDYIVVFSHNTTTAAQTVANLLKIKDSNSFSFFYLKDNHNSLIGLSTIFKEDRQIANIKCIENIEEINQKIDTFLFAYPMISNFNGKKYPLEWIKTIQEKTNGKGLVLLDAASTSCVDLSLFKPDFVVLSLLKLYGSHGGVLLVRRDRGDMLNDPAPSGGTLLYSCARNDRYKLLPSLSKKLEGGTVAYTDLMLALEGLKVRKEFGTEKQINKHLINLSRSFYQKVVDLKHKNGQKLIQFYHDNIIHKDKDLSRDSLSGLNDDDYYYPTFSFNILKDDGSVINHHDVLFVFSALDIIVRSGSHCNPGATFSNLDWDPEDVIRIGEDSVTSNRCFSSLCTVDGKPVATLRVSFGYPTLEKDIDKFVDVLKRLFLNGGPNPDPTANKNIVLPMKIERIFISPIIGCRGFEVKKSLFDRFGLLHDRRWKLVDDEGNQISTPQCFGVASLVAKVNYESNTLLLKYNRNCKIHYNKDEIIANERINNNDSIEVPIEDFEENKNAPEKVKKLGRVYSGKVSQFLCDSIGMYAYLVKLDPKQLGKFAFSCVTRESCESSFSANFDIEGWHANIVFGGAPPFAEEGLRKDEMRIAGRRITLWRWRTVCMTSAVVPKSKSETRIDEEIDNNHNHNKNNDDNDKEEGVSREEVRKLVETRSYYGVTPFGTLFCAEVGENGFAELAVGDFLTEG